MSVETHDTAAPRPIRRLKRLVRARQMWRVTLARFSSSLTRRIIVINMGGLVALLIGFLYLNQFRAGLIDARIQSLQTQGEIIAAAIAASATVETDAIAVDPEKLLQLAPGQSTSEADEAGSLEFSINPERVGPLLHRLVTPTKTRARVYDREGYLLLDSRSLARRSTILRSDLPPAQESAFSLARAWESVRRWAQAADMPVYRDIGGANGKTYQEVERALGGTEEAVVRANRAGETVVSIGVPIQRFRVVRGALLLSTEGGDIDAIIASERFGLLRVFLVSASVMLLLSLLFAGAVAGPIRRLAEAAERVRKGGASRHEIPDFSDRSDEIGHLSGALRDMTGALYNRIEAIESFAADVAHELKNPLTSLRSAVETLPIARTDEARARLLDVIQHDVRRLDRLISDISDASRLDAELARADMTILDLNDVAAAVVGIAADVDRGDSVAVALHPYPGPARTMGYESRIGQVLNNLIDNARSFSPPGGRVQVTIRPQTALRGERSRAGFALSVEDEGPGVPDHALERIFERFCTDRPEQGFGQNSGLGLSISRQIVEAHGGQIRAENRAGPDGAVTGARFVVWLPAAAA